MKVVYKNITPRRVLKNKANFMVHSSLLIVHSKKGKGYLKKQSQFAGWTKWLENSTGTGTLSDCTIAFSSGVLTD
jgi:hypothetical protein